MKKLLAFFIVLFIPCISLAEVWKIIPEKSSLSFTATQNNAPITGNFKIFVADINFDPNNLNASHVNVTIDINSLNASYQELVSTLLGPDWFDAKQFPKATFRSTSFSKLKNDEYQAQGNLTIRDKTIPITVFFKSKEYTKTSAVFVGHASVKRLLFGVGQGEWASTNEVKDEVVVNFAVTAKN